MQEAGIERNQLVADLQIDRVNALAKELKDKHGVDAEFLRIHVMEEDNINDMVARALKRWVRLDCVANCAGICEKFWDEEENITSAIFDKKSLVATCP